MSAPTGRRDFEALECALREALIERGVVAAPEIEQRIETMHARRPALGGRVVARAWTDAAYRQRLLTDGSAAVRELLGIDVGSLKLVVVENTPAVHNVIVCTLCSCYPRMLLGMPPDWYKSVEYRARVVREPRAVLDEFGLRFPSEVAVRVHDSTADMRYLVLPMRPEGSTSLAESELATLVSRDAMIGVALVAAPSEVGSGQA
ncbi:MAG: nitrile hydratase subunit alpha [Candidatus Eremiobacteraeota bacterium]|nr:nitrile hydratase subunit alpha [Candidatus Eremiobacteraeota bacterium]